MRKCFLDLFSGLGGASEAFLDGWDVLRIDNNPLLLDEAPDTILCDITDLKATTEVIREWYDSDVMPEIFVIWASPPCNQYSFANAKRDSRSFDNACVAAARALIMNWLPDYWIIENVHGARKTFTEILGHEPYVINQFCLWGKFPKFKVALAHRKLDAKGSRALRPNYRALVPYKFSRELRKTIETQQTLF